MHVGHTQDVLCPVAAVLSYIVERGVGPGPFFCYKDVTRASGGGGYSGHS